MSAARTAESADEVKEGGIGENAMKGTGWQIKVDEVLHPHFTVAVFAGQFADVLCSIKTNGGVTKPCESHQVSTRPTAEVQNMSAVFGEMATKASMFWLTSWSLVPSQKSSARSW